MGDLSRSRSLRRAAAGLAALACLLAWPAIAPAASSDAGQVKFLRNATSEFDPYLTGSTAEQQQWMRDHYYRMRGYAPFFDNHAIGWAPPTFLYRDLYAIYNSPGDDGLQLKQQHPDWVLHDSQGRPLYIDYNCSSGSCPQFAADIGNPQWRQWWISSVQAQLDQGYAGLHIDDVNMEMKVSDGNGNFVRPLDPRTDQPMTDANWRRYMADFTEQIRGAFPNTEISQNPLWWMSQGDPSVQREIDAADYIQLERSFSDPGLVNGSGQWGFETYLNHIDWLHSRGKAVVYEPKDLDKTGAVFELASYFLVNDGTDLMDSYYRADPGDWWQGWQTSLGAARGDRYAWKGLLRRDFAGGMVLVNEPDAATQRVTLPTGTVWKDQDGNRVGPSVTLHARQGAVLVDAGAAPSKVTLHASHRRVSRGSKVRLRGQAPKASRVIIQTRRKGGWHAVKRSSISSGYRYHVRVRARRSGVRSYRATAPGLRSSSTVRLKVKRA